MILNPNCSEAVMRISLNKLSEKEKDTLHKYIEELDKLANDESDEYDWWYETYTKDDSFCGINWIELEGETPFNHWNKLERYIKKLPFIDKCEIGYSE